MTMLRDFLDCSENTAHLFSGLYVESSPVFSKVNKYPVIYVSFKDLELPVFREVFAEEINNQLNRYLKPEQYPGELREHLENPNEFGYRLLKDATKILYTVYKIKPFVLIDEYDWLIMNNIHNPQLENIRNFVKSTLSVALKDNSYLGKAVLTGVNRLVHESIFSGLNNLDVYDVFYKSVYDSDFGLTENEVKELCTDEEAVQAKLWYNNYRIGNEKLYFTFSIMSYLKRGKLMNYWARSGVMDSIREFVTFPRFEVITQLVNGFGKETFTTTLGDRLSVEDILTFNQDSVFYSFLVQVGYLTFDETDVPEEYNIYLPNLELQRVWRDFILGVFEKTATSMKDIFKNMNYKIRFEAELKTLLDNKLSYFDVDKIEPEKTYHVFVLGMAVSVGYDCVSNRESGRGRYDLLVKLPNSYIIFEFKKAEAYEQMEDKALEALAQIDKKKYGSELTDGLPVHKVGIGFCMKECVVRLEE
ncbi:hypothetical protein FACS1894188_10330 [Clostridia bacterium]|nr:hypothetical protein FACS1894188_10330 [Clostridia bacterium]